MMNLKQSQPEKKFQNINYFKDFKPKFKNKRLNKLNLINLFIISYHFDRRTCNFNENYIYYPNSDSR